MQQINEFFFEKLMYAQPIKGFPTFYGSLLCPAEFAAGPYPSLKLCVSFCDVLTFFQEEGL